MSLRHLLVALAVLLAAAIGWRSVGGLSGLQRAVTPEPPPAAPIVFDNGSTRSAAPGPSAPPAPRAAAARAAGGMTKCVRGSRTIYGDARCPDGWREVAVGGPPVNVLPATPVPGRAAADGAGPSMPGGSARRTLHDALDLSHDPQLRQRMVDRAVDREAADR